jgi:outer membrane protein
MRKLWCLLAFMATALPAAGQSAAGPTLSLDQALTLAKANNPTYLQSGNGRRRADANLRSAKGAYLPSASTNLGSGYRQGKPQFFGGVEFGSNSDQLSSSWGLNVSANLSASSFSSVKAARSNVAASESDMRSAEQNLRFAVTGQYFLVLEDQAQSHLQDTLVSLNQLQVDLARAKAGVGSATSLDVKRAEVALGTQQVAALRARNTYAVDLLRLFQSIGIPPQVNVQLTTIPAVTEPKFDLNQLLATATQSNPALRSLFARIESAKHRQQLSRHAGAGDVGVVESELLRIGFAPPRRRPPWHLDVRIARALKRASRPDSRLESELPVQVHLESVYARPDALASAVQRLPA